MKTEDLAKLVKEVGWDEARAQVEGALQNLREHPCETDGCDKEGKLYVWEAYPDEEVAFCDECALVAAVPDGEWENKLIPASKVNASKFIYRGIQKILQDWHDGGGEWIVEVGGEELSFSLVREGELPSYPTPHLFEVYVGEKSYKVSIEVEED